MYSGTENSLRFDREPFECALYLYHTNFCILLDVLRIIMTYAVDETMPPGIRAVLQDFLNAVIGESAESFPKTCLRMLDQAAERLQSLEDTEKRNALLGSGLIQSDHAFIGASLHEEHESISLCLAMLCRLRPDSTSHLVNIVQDLKLVETWTTFVSHKVMIMLQSIQALGLIDDIQVSLVPGDIDSVGPTFRSLIQLVGIRSTDEWRCVAICSILQVVLATELNGLCKENEEIATQFDYEQELLLMARQAIEKNAFQNMITWSLFTRNDVEKSHPFSVFFTSDALAHYQATRYHSQSGLLSAALDDCHRSFSQSFIMHMADLLKEMHLQAEDSLSIQEVSEVAPGEDEYHQEDLFFGLIFTAFEQGNDLGFSFWDDKESDLYGFLVWASHAQVPSAIYSFFKMIGALSTGPRCADAAHAFFNQASSDPGSASTSSPSFTVSWDFIFDSLRYYIRQLDRRQGATNFSDPLEIDLHNALVLDSYLTSMHCILWNLQDSAAILEVHAKFDVSTILFQLLACRLPSELYASIFCLLSAFARCTTLKNGLWQQLEGWLATVEVGTDASMLSSTVRRKQLEHRPVNCLTTFSESAPESIVPLVNLLTTLIQSDTDKLGSLPFPESLGDNSRYHGITDYVDFVLNILLSAQSDGYVSLLKRLDISSACMQFLQTSIETLDLDLIHLFRSGHTSIDADIVASSLQQYLLLHPGTYVIQRLDENQVRAAILAIIKSHDAVDSAVRERLIPVVELALDICCSVLSRMDTFDEFVRPQVFNRETDVATFSAEIVTDSDLFIYACLLSSSLDFECSSKALDLIQLFGQLNLAAVCRRHLAALTSVDQSKRILSGFMHLVDQRDNIFTSRKLKFLRYLVADLDLANQQKAGPSIAHFLLGFRIESNYAITEGDSSGEIGSGRSLLHCILEFVSLDDGLDTRQASNDNSELRTTANHILLLLCEDPLASPVVMPILRSNNYLISLLTQEKYFKQSPQSAPDTVDLSTLIDRTLEFSIRRKADLLRYCSKELLTCKSVQAGSLLQKYIEFLVSSKDDSTRYDVLLLDYLEVVHLASSTPPAKNQWQHFPSDLINNLLMDLSPAGIRRLQLALNVILKKKTTSSEANICDAVKKEHRRIEFYLADIIEKARSRVAISLCLQEWKSLAIVMFDVLESVQHPARSAIASDISQRLLINLPELQETDSDLADTLSEALVGIANLLKQDAMNLDGSIQFFKRIVSVLESPASTQLQREHLYLTGTTSLQILAHSKIDLKSNAVAISKTGSDRLFTITCQDTIAANETLKISACIFLDLMLQECEDQTNPWLSNNIVRLNLVNRFLHHFETTWSTSDSSETVGRQFDLILRLAMTRAGAREISLKDNLMKALARKYFDLDGLKNSQYAMYNLY